MKIQSNKKESKINNIIAVLAIVVVAVALFNFTSFITMLGITGTIAGGLDGILIILMYWKAKLLGDRNPEYSMGKHYFLGTLLMIMFGLGMVYYFIF